MLKFVYKFLGLIVVFVAALFVFSKNIEVITVNISTEKVKPEAESFPIISIVDGDDNLNYMYGYSGNIPANTVRESITVLDSEKTVTLEFDEFKTKINKLNYEVRSVEENEALDSGTVTAFVNKDEKNAATIKFNTEFETSTEYALKITLVTNVSKKINYYTRLKYYPTDCFLKEKLDFVKNFHQMTINKDEKLAMYIEPEAARDNSSLAFVDINSSYENITWGMLEPNVLTKIVPTVKEINIETGSFEIRYYMMANTPTGNETYFVKEFYRLRRTDERIYMLWFERTMEAEFDAGLASINKNELKLGVSNSDDIQIVTNDNVNKVAFVRNGNVYEYDLTENVIKNIYISYLSEESYEHMLYRQNNAHVMSVDEEGNISFVVYGYIPHGAYEGKVAIILYRYNISENAVEELLYIPFETTYQILKENFEKYSYMNSGDVFFFAIDDIIYSYNLVSEKLVSLADGIGNRNFTIIPKISSYVWESRQDSGVSTELTIMDLESGNKVTIPSKDGQFIRLIGVMDTNVVYGFGSISDIAATNDGTRIYAMSEVNIVTNKNKIIKSYSSDGVYVTGAEVEDNVVHLKRCKKDENGRYKTISDDNILNRIVKENSKVELTTRVTEKMMTEHYMSFPSGFSMLRLPKLEDTEMFVVTNEKVLYLDGIDSSEGSAKYYVYAKGEIKGSYKSPAKAILTADEEQGVVINSNNMTTWERGGKFLQSSAMGIEYVPVSKKKKFNSIEACSYMLLKTMRIQVSKEEIAALDKPIYDILAAYIPEPVNLTGCNLDEVLYFVSAGKPVIAMKDGKKAVLLTAYDSSTVTVYDPSTDTTERIYLSMAEETFNNAGNVYVSYMKGDK